MTKGLERWLPVKRMAALLGDPHSTPITRMLVCKHPVPRDPMASSGLHCTHTHTHTGLLWDQVCLRESADIFRTKLVPAFHYHF